MKVSNEAREAAAAYLAALVPTMPNLAEAVRENPTALARAFAAFEKATLERAAEDKYKAFTDGMEAAAEICGSLAETTYDDTDTFEAATGCEAAIMKVVKEHRIEQAAIRALGETE